LEELAPSLLALAEDLFLHAVSKLVIARHTPQGVHGLEVCHTDELDLQQSGGHDKVEEWIR